MIIETNTHRYKVVSPIIKTMVASQLFWIFIAENWLDDRQNIIYIKPTDILKMEMPWEP